MEFKVASTNAVDVVSQLRTMRRLRDISQRSVAKAIFREKTMISLLETGKRKLAVQHMLDIASFLGFDVHITFVERG